MAQCIAAPADLKICSTLCWLARMKRHSCRGLAGGSSHVRSRSWTHGIHALHKVHARLANDRRRPTVLLTLDRVRRSSVSPAPTRHSHVRCACISCMRYQLLLHCSLGNNASIHLECFRSRSPETDMTHSCSLSSERWKGVNCRCGAQVIEVD